MKKLLLITGDLATGKSTFGQILSERYSLTAMYKDKIKEILSDRVGFGSREENLKLSLATVDMMIYSFSQVSIGGQDMILEANFKEDELKRIKEIADARGYKTLTLVLRADMDVIYKRFINRIENENRHPAHISGFDGYDSLKYYIDLGRKQGCFGDVMEIDANDFSYQSDEAVISKIDVFIGEK